MRRFQVWLAAGGLVALLGIPGATLTAQGYSVNEHGTCAMARAGTAVAAPCADGSAIYYNPAGLMMTGAGKSVLTLSGTFIAPRGAFTADAGGSTSLENHVYPVPSAYFVHGFGRWSAGIGAFAPYGLTTEWPADSPERFLGYKSRIQAIYVQPTVAARLNDYVSLGAGVDFNFLSLNLRQRLELSSQQLPSPAPLGATFANLGVPVGTDFGDANLTGSGNGVGFHVGALVKATDRISFGARYLSRQTVKVDNGTVKFNPVSTGITLAAGNPFAVPAGTPLDAVIAPEFAAGATLGDQGAATELRMPEQYALGVAVKATDKLKVLGDVTLQHWEVFDSLVVTFDQAPTEVLREDNQNTTTLRLGGEYAWSPTTTLRLGVLGHNGASPGTAVTPNLPEGRRMEYTGGIGFGLNDKLHLDLAYQYIDQGDRRGRIIPQGLPNNGVYAFHAHLFGATLSYAF